MVITSPKVQLLGLSWVRHQLTTGCTPWPLHLMLFLAEFTPVSSPSPGGGQGRLDTLILASIDWTSCVAFIDGDIEQAHLIITGPHPRKPKPQPYFVWRSQQITLTLTDAWLYIQSVEHETEHTCTDSNIKCNCLPFKTWNKKRNRHRF